MAIPDQLGIPLGVVRPRVRPPRPRGAGTVAAHHVPDHLANQALPGRTRAGPTHGAAGAARPGVAGRGRTRRHPGPVRREGPRVVAPRRLRDHRDRVPGERGTRRSPPMRGGCRSSTPTGNTTSRRSSCPGNRSGSAPTAATSPSAPSPPAARRSPPRPGTAGGGPSPGRCWMGGPR